MNYPAYIEFLYEMIEELVIAANGNHDSLEWSVSEYLSTVLEAAYYEEINRGCIPVGF